jgi:hypothetical protein
LVIKNSVITNSVINNSVIANSVTANSVKANSAKKISGYNKQKTIAYWFGSLCFRLILSLLLYTPLLTNKFDQS